QNDMVAANTMQGSVVASGTVFQSTALNDLLVEAGFADKIVKLFTTIANNVFDIIYNGGIQMLMFLAGLQSIPSSLYEAASVEGATGWESFWKITLPGLLPVILINIVYTVVDCFTASQNAVMRQVMQGIKLMRYEEAAAMLWVYCIVIMVFLGLIFLLFRRANDND
ncbi:MAG: carbohydrate ABC transporter permease, partial [Acutalibacteraceae bacterium]